MLICYSYLFFLRDRDIIEQGDWSEINNELTDNSFLGKSPSNGSGIGGGGGGGGAVNRQRGGQDGGNRISNPINRNNSNANSNVSLNNNNSNSAINSVPAAIRDVSNSKAVHGPRGGRHFRSAADETPPAAAHKQLSAVQFKSNNNSNKGNNNNNDNFQIEGDSDNDSTSSKNNRDKEKGSFSNKHNKVTPRSKPSSMDRLDPIPLPAKDYEEGLLSGRRYDNNAAAAGGGGNSRNSRHNAGNPSDNRERDLSRYDNNSNNNHSGENLAQGYAPVYPSLFNKDRDSAGGIGGINSKNGPRNAAVAPFNPPSQQQQQAPYRRNSKGTGGESEDEAGGAAGGFSDLNIGGRGMSNANSKASISAAKNVALGKLKGKGINSSDNLAPAAAVGGIASNNAAAGGGGLNRNNGALSALDISPSVAAASAAERIGAGGDNNNFGLNINGNGFNNNSNVNNSNITPTNSNAPNNSGGVSRPKLKPSR